MICTNPYKTSYGSLLNIAKPEAELKKYIITASNKNLNYEYQCNPTSRLVIITGGTQEEKEMTIFNHPIIFQDIKGNDVIAIDIRKYVKPHPNYPMSVSEVAKDKAGVNYLVNSSLIIADFNNEDFGDYRTLYESITVSYAVFVSYIVNFLVPLNPLEKVYVETAACYYANAMLTPGTADDLPDYNGAIAARISHTKLSLPVVRKTVDEVISNLTINEISTKTLINIIKAVLPEEKAELINETAFINHLSNMWYGPGGNEALIIGLDNIAIWISLVYSCLSDVTYKKSRFSNILEKHSKNINSKEFVRILDLLFKSKIMS